MMGRVSFFLSVLICLFGQLQANDDQLIVILLMVKNEATVMEKTLEPFLKAGIQNYLILDTGSTDGTIEVTQKLFEAYSVEHGHIVKQPFVDFATSRNYAIEQAEQKFSDATFFLMLDAEWYMRNVDKLLQFCAEHRNGPEQAFFVSIQTNYHANKQDNKYYHVTRLFRAHRDIRFMYPVHEDIFVDKQGYLPDDIYFFWDPEQIGLEQSDKRKTRDLEILLQELEKDPDNYRTLFFLGQTYVALNDLDNAILYYTKAFDVCDCASQQSYTLYIIARIYDVLDNWKEALFYYMKSYCLNPLKAEPLIRLAEYYCYKEEYRLAYFFALQATKIPHPSGFMTEKYMYDYTRYNILGTAAWYVGEYEVGQDAVLKALEYKPDAQHLHTNLRLHRSKL